MSNKLRCFIAIDLDGPMKRHITEIRKKLYAIDHLVKWVDPNNAHITLKFLGDLSLEQISTISQSLMKTTQLYERTSFTTTGLNAFPDLRSPRIIFLDIAENNTLMQLSQTIKKELAQLDTKKDDGDFTAHITLGRVKSSVGAKQIAQCIEKITDLPSFGQELKSINLYKSNLTSQGPVYECLFESFLKENPHV